MRAKRIGGNIVIPLAVLLLDVVMKRAMGGNPGALVNRAWLGFSAASFWFLAASCIVLAIVGVVWIRSCYALSYGLVFVGGFSNLIDRIVCGGVIDYFFIGDVALNLADLSIWAGCILLFFSFRRQRSSESGW